MRCWTCAWIEQTTNTPHLQLLEFWGGKRKTTECMRCCNFAQIWHPSPYNYIFRSFEVGNEKGRTEEIEFDNLDTTTHNFIFPNLEVGHGIKTENTQSRLSQVHEMLSMCMNWTNYTPHTYIFSSFEVGKKKRQRKKMQFDLPQVHEML